MAFRKFCLAAFLIGAAALLFVRSPEESRGRTRTSRSATLSHRAPAMGSRRALPSASHINQSVNLPLAASFDSPELASVAIDAVKMANPHDLRVACFGRTESEVGGRMAYGSYQRTLGGIPVEGDLINLTVKELHGTPVIVNVAYRMNRDLPASFEATLDEEAAKAVAAVNMSRPVEDVGAIRKIIRKVEGTWRLVADIFFAKSIDKAVVDLATGTCWKERSVCMADTVSGTVQGRGIGFDPGRQNDTINPARSQPIEDPLIPLQMPHVPLNIRVIQSGVYVAFANADKDGRFSIPVQAAGNYQVVAMLDSPWVEVLSDGATLGLTASSYVSTREPGTLFFNPSGNDPEIVAQVNAYYHIHAVRDYLISRGIPENYLQQKLTCYVNMHRNEANAFYDPAGKTLHFTAATDDGHVNMAYDTIIYHEYAHYVDDMTGGIINKGLSEGWGDLVATFMTGQPLQGESVRGPGTYIRTVDNTYGYVHGDQEEIHLLGQSWSGFAWSARRNLIASLGHDRGIRVAEELFIPVLMANSLNIPDAVKEVFLRAAHDGNVSNGTPYWDELIRAARDHDLAFAVVPEEKSEWGPDGGYHGYATNFDVVDGEWKTEGLWNVDATPAEVLGASSVRSSPFSLNYNGPDGTYDLKDEAGHSVANKGTATSPLVAIGGFRAPVLRFWCNYDTDTSGTRTDRRFLQLILPDQTLVYPLAGNGANRDVGLCAAMGTWHQHQVALDPSWGSIRVRLLFDTIDNVDNAHAGWFIDDLSIGEK